MAIGAISANADNWVRDPEPAILEVHYTRIQITDTTQRHTHFFKDPVMLRVGATKSLFCGVKRLWKDSLAAVNPSLESEIYIGRFYYLIFQTGASRQNLIKPRLSAFVSCKINDLV